MTVSWWKRLCLQSRGTQGLKAGDIIPKVGHTAVTSPEGVIEEVKKMKAKEKPVLLLVQRRNNQRYVALKTG